MRRKAFTLVELLVVIGIIAVLIGILLPALNAARRSANAVKCASSMREIGNATQMYCLENHQFMPPLHLYFSGGSSYNLDGTIYAPTVNPAYWYNFLGKYLTKTKLGFAATSATDAAQSQNSVFWGCPAFTPYPAGVTTTAGATQGDIVIVQTGYGWNGFPEFSPSFPGINEELGEATAAYTMDVAIPASADNWHTLKFSSAPSSLFGKWYKQKDYSKSADRALLGDSRFYVLESRPPNAVASGTDTTMYGMPTGYQVWASTHSTTGSTVDFYRHGKLPPVDKTDSKVYSLSGGKISYNLLFCDGHVAAQTGMEQAYKTVRMRFPG